MYQYYYLEQAELVLADSQTVGGDTAITNNREALATYEDSRLKGELPKRFDSLGNEVIPVEATPEYDVARVLGESFKSILCELDGVYSFNLSSVMPGILSYNKDDLTVNVMLTERDWMFAKTQRMKFGKFLTKTGQFNDVEVNEMTNKFKSTILMIDTAELSLAFGQDIKDIYRNGPNSCMSGDDFYQGDEHPAGVYDSPDIACAYVELDGRIVARTMVNAIEDTYTTIYGNAALLSPLLEKEGYKSGSLDGCRIKQLPYNDSYIMPYLDDASTVSFPDTDIPEQEGYFIVDDCGDVFCNCTNGLSDECGQCHECGDHIHPDESIWIEQADELFCSESCIEEFGYVYAWESGIEYRDYYLRDNTYYCETDGEYYSDSGDLVEVDDMYYLEDDDTIIYSDDQDEWLLKVDAVTIEGIGAISDDRVSSC